MKNIWRSSEKTEMSILEHLEELRERFFIVFILFILVNLICIMYIKPIAYLLQEPAQGIKFLQLAPGEYLFVSLKVSISLSSIITSPFIIYQIILFILPGLTEKEKTKIVPLLTSSIILFFTGILFSFKLIIPAALHFLINYGSDVIEPLWSFEEYFNFIITLLFSTGLSFQIPIIQIILGIFNIYSSNQMLNYWKYIIFIMTILAAIITPSTDPITQTVMILAMLLLYSSGIAILKILHK